jgi:hypothetical protein
MVHNEARSLDARSVGKQHASVATPNIIAVATPNTAGFPGVMPYSNAAMNRAATKASRMPIAMPDIVR